MPRPAKPGDDFRRHLTTRWYNESIKNRTEPSPLKTPPPENPVRIMGVADTGLSFDRFDVVNISAPLLDFDDWGNDYSPQYETIKCKVDDNVTTNGWGIVQGPCDEQTPAPVVVLGLTWANFDYTSPETHVTADSGSLESFSSGEALIISPPASGQTTGLILITGSGGTGSGGIIDIRYNAPDLQYTFDGINWTTWHTTQSCPTSS
jgi:hypothetical protein